MIKESPLQQILLKLKSVFPEAVTEMKQADEDGRPYYTYALKEEFIRQLEEAGLDLADDQNRYELQFPGKQTAKAAVFTPCHKTLIADREQSKNFDDTGNVFIEGDNLDALRMLQNSYRGKVKVIYIDPPYNTGNDDFVYNDDFSVKQKAYLQAAGVLDEDGVRQISEIQTGLKGRFHAGWLAFMYPRLKLARELLSDDGVIFISIDDNEQANLKLICDEIFGEENFVANISWWSKYTLSNDAVNVSYQHENILFYGKNKDAFHIGLLPRTEQMDSSYKNPDEDPKGKWKATPLHAKSGRESDRYSIEFANGVTWKCPEGCFPRYNKKRMLDLYESGQLYFGKNGKRLPNKKTYLSEVKNGKTIGSIWPYKEVGSTHEANEEFSDMLGKGIFDNPKGTKLLKRIIQVGNVPQNGIILDFFAGSATTAHAVMQLNAEDGGNRKFILVQLPEMIDPKKSKEAHKFCTDELKRPPTIAEIAKERIRRAGAQLVAESSAPDIDVGFRAFVIQESLLSNREEGPFAKTGQADLKRYVIKLKPEFFVPILYETLLKTGVPLHLPMVTDKIENHPFAICDRRCYCVTEDLSQKIVQTIIDKHGESFDILYYLSDALNATTSFTEIEAVIHQAPGNKQIQGLAFY